MLTRVTKQEAVVSTFGFERSSAGLAAGVRHEPGVKGRILLFTAEAEISGGTVTLFVFIPTLRTGMHNIRVSFTNLINFLW